MTHPLPRERGRGEGPAVVSHDKSYSIIGPLQASAVYGIIVGAWVLSAISFALLALRLGKAKGEDNDGCLLAISNVLLAGFGGGLGFLVLSKTYPLFILSSIAGAILLPALHTIIFLRKRRR